MQIKRDLYLNRLIDRKHNQMIKIVGGIRCCGKSWPKPFKKQRNFHINVIAANFKQKITDNVKRIVYSLLTGIHDEKGNIRS